MEQGEKVVPVGSTMVLHICTNIVPLLKYWVAPISSVTVLCLCVNLIPTKYYVAPVGSARMPILFSMEYYATPLCTVTYAKSLTGLGSISKMQRLLILNMYREVCVLS
jgi:hypothetical protein